MKEDKVQALTKQLEEGIKDFFESDRYKEYLDVMSKFHNYSSNNIGLILLQKPDTSRVAGFNAWKNNFKRSVNKGEKGIAILAPAPWKKTIEVDKIDPNTNKVVLKADGTKEKEQKEITQNYFRVVYVFDVSQTSGEPLPELVSKLSDKVQDFDDLFLVLKNVSEYPIEYEDIKSGANGYCDLVNKRIAIKEGLGEAHIIKTTIHEIAHAILHSDLKNRDKDSSTREVEAESIAYVVSNSLGIDTSSYSFGYVGAWSKDKELTQLKSSLDTIQKTANDLISNIEKELLMLERNRENNLNISLYDGEIDLDRIKEENIEVNNSSFSIYQIFSDKDLNNIRFLSYEDLEKMNIKFDSSLYTKVYEGDLEKYRSLEDMFIEFNTNLPSNYTGRSLSISDVILLNNDVSQKAYYVNHIGFIELPNSEIKNFLNKNLDLNKPALSQKIKEAKDKAKEVNKDRPTDIKMEVERN